MCCLHTLFYFVLAVANHISAHVFQAINLKDCDVYTYQSDMETDPFGE